MRIVKLLAAGLLSLTLSACFHIQLRGSVGEGQFTITPLRDPANIVYSANSLGPSFYIDAWGQEFWDTLETATTSILLGIVNLTPTDLDPETLYLVSASGGLDYAPETMTGQSDTAVNVQGQWHAIATGAQLMEIMADRKSVVVSALTEAMYLQLKNRLGEYTDAEIMARLEATSKQLVHDVDESGSVDYKDVLQWKRDADAATYCGDIADLDQLANAITAGQPEAMLAPLAKNAVGRRNLRIETNFGAIELETLNCESPITVRNFLDYVAVNYYDQVIFHRVINNFMIQTGIWEFLGDGLVDAKAPNASIVNESSNGVLNLRGTLAMARTSDPDSASSQFFINQVDNPFLDNGSSENPDGYAVFARVTSGMDVVDTIAALPTIPISGIGQNVPRDDIVLIESVTVLD